jgi:hypothetical protein
MFTRDRRRSRRLEFINIMSLTPDFDVFEIYQRSSAFFDNRASDWPCDARQDNPPDSTFRARMRIAAIVAITVAAGICALWFHAPGGTARHLAHAFASVMFN